MKTRRFLAVLLCAAMVLTSNAFNVNAFAETVDGQNSDQTVIVEMEEESIIEEENSVTDESVSELNDETSEDEASGESEEVISDDESGDEISDGESDENISDEELSDEEGLEEEADLEDELEGEELEEDLEEEDLEEALEDIESEEKDAEDKDIDNLQMAAADKYFDPEATTLTLKDEYAETGLAGLGKIDGVRIPAAVTTIPADIKLFKGNKNIPKIEFETGSKLATIDANAFDGSAIEEILLPLTLSSIGESAFENCTSLTKVTFSGTNLTNIPAKGFQGCSKLASVKIPAGVTNIGDYAFKGCSALDTLDLGNVETIGAYAFTDDPLMDADSITWSKKLTTIGEYAFANNTASTELYLSSCQQLTSVGNFAFSGWTKLTNEVYLPKSLTTISEGMFSGCTSITGISLHDNIYKVMKGAFENCKVLTSVTFNNQNTDDPEFYIDLEAFPTKPIKSENKFLTIHGYDEEGSDGAVYVFASTVGYKYDGKKENYSFTSEIVNTKGVSCKDATLRISPRKPVTGEPKKAPEGTQVKVTVIPNEGKTLVKTGGNYLKITSMDGSTPYSDSVKLIGFSETEMVFEFTMPSEDVKITATINSISNAVNFGKTPNWKVIGFDESDPAKGTCYVKASGHNGQLVVYNQDGKEICPWLLSYSSSNPKVASIDDYGYIRALGGTNSSANITATVKSTGAKATFKLTIGKGSVVKKFDISLENKFADQDPEEIDGDIYQVMEFGKSKIDDGNQTITASLTVFDEGNEEIFASSKWVSTNTAIATVSRETTLDNSNTITVKKGSEGEAVIKVTIAGQDDTGKAVDITNYILIRVINNQPRLLNPKLAASVNSDHDSTTLPASGATSGLVPVYGYEITKVYPDLYTNAGKKQDWSTVVYIGGVVGVKINSNDTPELSLKSGASKTFKDSTRLNIKVTVEKDGRSEDVYVPITELTVSNTIPNPTVSMSGKINLFFNSLAAETDQGSVTLKQSLTKEFVTDFKLVSTEYYNWDIEQQKAQPANSKHSVINKDDDFADDKFANNFEIMDINGVGHIRRTENDLEVDAKGKAITAGYVYMWFEGYTEPVVKKITIPTQNTKPTYVLSKTSATTTVYNEDQQYVLQLLDKKTKAVIDLHDKDGELCEADFDALNTTPGLWKDDEGDIVIDTDEDTLTLSVDGTPIKGKAVIQVKQPEWSEPLKFTFSLSTTNKNPTAKASKTSVSLNNYDIARYQEIEFTSSNAEIPLSEVPSNEVVFAGSAKQAAEAAKIEITNSDANVLKIALSDRSIVKGSYKFKVYPYVQYDSYIDPQTGDPIPVKLSPVTITVKVVSEQPTIKLKTSKFTSNALYPGIEKFETTFTMSNLPDSSLQDVDDSEMEIVPFKDGDITSLSVMQALNIEFDGGKMYVSLKPDAPRFKYSCKYKLTGLTIDGVVIKDVQVEIASKDSAVKISAKASGTLNTLDENSVLKYKISFTNLTVTDYSNARVTFREIKPDNTEIRDDDLKNFDLVNDGKIDSEGYVGIKVKEGKQLDSKTKYRIMLTCKVGPKDESIKNAEASTGWITVTPKQVMPKLKTDVSKVTFYAGEVNRTRDITITRTTEPGVTVKNIAWANGTADNIKKAFNITTYVDDTGEGVLTLRLVNPGQITIGKATKLNLVIECEGQMANTTGTAFSIEVTVNK